MTNSRLKFPFDREKAIEIILYIAKKVDDPSYHSISKVLYTADKFSLAQYGRQICGGDYYAMKYGPVPSEVYHLMKTASTPTEDVGFAVQNKKEILSLRDPDLDLLSGADIECLDKALEIEGRADFDNRTDRSHDAAYHAAWDNKPEQAKRMLMPLESIVSILDNGEIVLNHLLHRR